MPYKDPEVRKQYNRKKSREHYQANRQHYIDRSAARKRRVREEQRGAAAMTITKPTTKRRCPKCSGPMFLEEMGGRNFWQCDRATCGGRILLDKPNTAYTPPEAPAIAAAPAPSPTKTYGRGKRPPLSEEARRRIGEGIRKAHADKRARAGQASVSPEKIRVIIPEQLERLAPRKPQGAQDRVVTALQEALEEVTTEEHQLQTALRDNQAKQAVIRKAMAIIQGEDAA